MVKVNHLILVVLVILGAMMTYKVFIEDSSVANLERAYAQGGATGNSEIIAVPVLSSNNEEKLFLIKKQAVRHQGSLTPEEWHMVVYGMDGGRTLKLESARLIEFDFHISDYNLAKQKKLSPEEMRERAKKGEKPTKKK